jgi:outer membrane protein OmpA-like peptidoglycan-associated protein
MIRTFALTLLLALGTAAQAQNTVYYGATDRIDPAEVARILGGPPKPFRTRSIRLLEGAAAAAAQPAGPSTLSVPVQFAFDSAAILPSARDQLDAIAAGIKMLPAGRSVVVEGHTDAIGSDSYNLDLSQRRAAAVKTYLVQNHGLDPERLKPIGLGEGKPIEGLSPAASENRRVQFKGG